MKEYSTKEERIAAVKALWTEWLVTFGAVNISVVASVLVNSVWLAVFVAVTGLGLNIYAENVKRNGQTGCMRFAMLTSRALFISALVMCAINLLFHSRWLVRIFDPATVNTTIPFIASLIIFPTVCVVCIYAYFNHGNSTFCRRCKETHGYRPEEGFVGNFFHHETASQLRLMIWLSGLISLVDWIYYAYFYINVNLNAPDKFFFVIMPASVFILSLIYVGRHYFIVIEDIRTHAEGIARNARRKIVRYLIIRDDMLLLNIGEHNLLDTPAETQIESGMPLTEQEARKGFRHIADIESEEFGLRELYCNRSLTYRSTICHYLVTLPGNNDDPLPAGWDLKGEWATLPTIDRFLKMGLLAPALGAEIHRVYTIAMAWKTYDRQGRRLYPIKNYRPTFRLRDIMGWDVDFNDTSWFDIAANNQDRPFWHIGRLWRQGSKLGKA